MKIATHFRDPQSVAKKHCDALLESSAAEGLPYLQGLAIATSLPDDAPQGRLLVVRSADWLEYVPPVLGVMRIRLVAWSLDEDEAWDIASWFHGHLLALPGDTDYQTYRYDSGPRKAIDPDYDTPICGATLRMRMRAAIL